KGCYLAITHLFEDMPFLFICQSAHLEFANNSLHYRILAIAIFSLQNPRIHVKWYAVNIYKFHCIIFIFFILSIPTSVLCQTDDVNGIKKVFHPSGQIQSELPYKDGKLNGIAKYYFENGNIKQEIPYANGLKHGLEKGYYANGKYYQEVQYKQGEINGSWKEFYDTGIVRSEAQYRNGIRHGFFRSYSSNAKLKKEEIWQNDKKVLIRTYDKEGNLESEKVYKRGRFISVK
ncbi:MAG: toxin-antitoxin system YwqK family antitoxin, partial [Candidatus Omnitrophota bacterium]